ncbi:RNA polymerase I-specific transcription initiation factor-domain-containing protein [Nemania sp. FL0031]|nr:RNA polymerase I-specific transcription initiation factor-domain-containing protein [Nemania sp. FL0031]
MAYAGNESDEYLPDSDDSHDEDERLNRWTGPPSTWQQLNGAEIDTLTALNQIRNQDLSVHLYNAFALKHRHQKNKNNGDGKARDATKLVPSHDDVDVRTGQPVQADKWVPPNAWTAWPLPANVVPRPEFMKPPDADDDRSTFRMQTHYSPKTELEETISASILRLAKEKFRARQAAQRDENAAELGVESNDEDGSDAEMSSTSYRARSRSRARSVSKPRMAKYESASDHDAMDVDDPNTTQRASSLSSRGRIPLKTVVATDDELSYSLLRPSVQGILEKLDTTLAVLHHAQESRTHCPSESDASDASSRSMSRSRSRSRGPTRSHSLSPEARRRQTPNPAPLETAATDVKKRGRPKKVYPRLDGETERAHAVRIARLRKKPIPYFPEDDASDSTPAPNSAAEYTDRDRDRDRRNNSRAKSRTRKARAQSRPRRRSSAARSGASASAGEDETGGEKIPRKPRMSRARLRDWRDILGAAALAGFPPAALDRAARRCADLFGQNFTLHTLREGPLEQGGLDKRVCYEPGMGMPSLLDDSENNDNDNGESSRRPLLRMPSMPPSEGEIRSRGRSGSAAPRKMSMSMSQSRSRSASGPGRYFCMISNCPRAVEPFSRRLNLMRHLKLVHMYDGDEIPVEVDSQDETHGAVHVDGFLKPIKVRPGWRGDDAAREKRRPRRRAREVKGEEGKDTRMRDADSTVGDEGSD